MDELWEHEDVDPYSEADAKAEWDDVLGILRQQYRHTDSEGKQDLIVKWYNDYFMPFRTIEKITKTTFYHIIKALGMDDGSWEEEDDNYDD